MSPDRETFRRKAAERFQPARNAIGRIPTNRDEAKTTAANAFWEFTRLTVRHEVFDPNGNFEAAATHLKTGSLLVIVNHFDRLDTTVAGHVMEDHLPPLERVHGVTALRYLDPDRSALISKTIDTVRGAKGFSIIPVVQDKPEEIEYYAQNTKATKGKEPERFNRHAMIDAIRVLGQDGSILMMAPEGTRSPKGRLLRGHEGLDSILRMSRRKALVLPLAIVPPDTRRIVPPYTKVQVIPGELFSLEDIQQEAEANPNPNLTLTDRMMMRLAELLPQRNWGYYGRFISLDGSHRTIPPHPDVPKAII